MPSARPFLDFVLESALTSLATSPVEVFTFAFYHDHESGAVSICIDTKESSDRHVPRWNSWTMKYFAEHIASGSLSEARLFQANTGRSLSPGDFAAVNVARTDIPDDICTDEMFYIEMVRSVIAHQQDILRHSSIPDNVLFCSSGPDNEVDLVWAPLAIQP